MRQIVSNSVVGDYGVPAIDIAMARSRLSV